MLKPDPTARDRLQPSDPPQSMADALERLEEIAADRGDRELAGAVEVVRGGLVLLPDMLADRIREHNKDRRRLRGSLLTKAKQ